MQQPTPKECPADIATHSRPVTVGLPAPADAATLFPLTPEGASMLIDHGFTLLMERGAADSIHYTDEQYMRAGVKVVGRSEAWHCSIVIYTGAPLTAEARLLRRGALLLTAGRPSRWSAEALRVVINRGVITVALDMIGDNSGNKPFADILHEIDGRAAVVQAASMLADRIDGKGILLGGVAGIVPCEVTVIGSDIAAMAAAHSALGLGAVVRMFDNDVYRLRSAALKLGPAVIGSAMHPRVLATALHTADVVIATDLSVPFAFDAGVVAGMKRGVITFDLSERLATFPSMPLVDLGMPASPTFEAATSSAQRICYTNAVSTVPRTAAMALSNTLATLFSDIVACDGVGNALELLPGVQRAVLTFMGRAVEKRVARLASMRYVDIKFLLQLS